MDVRVELLVYYLLSAEEDKTGFLEVVMDCFDQLYFKERPISLTVVTISTMKNIYDGWDYVRILNKIIIC